MLRRSYLARYTPLQRTGWVRRSTRTRRNRRSNAVARSRRYLDWIRSLPCTVDGCLQKSQAAHTGGHGYAVKASDYSAIPLCAEHHLWEYAGSYHRLGRRAFELRYGLDVAAVNAGLIEEYAEERAC